MTRLTCLALLTLGFAALTPAARAQTVVVMPAAPAAVGESWVAADGQYYYSTAQYPGYVYAYHLRTWVPGSTVRRVVAPVVAAPFVARPGIIVPKPVYLAPRPVLRPGLRAAVIIP